MGVACDWCIHLSLCTRRMQELQVMENVGVVTKGRTLLVITQVCSGVLRIIMFIFNKYKYLQVEIATLANVKSCVKFINGKCLALYSLHGLPLSLSTLTEGSSMITVSSSDVKIQ